MDIVWKSKFANNIVFVSYYIRSSTNSKYVRFNNVSVWDLFCCISYWLLYFSHERVEELIEKICIPMLCFAIIGAVFYAIRYKGSDYTSSACLQSIITNLYLWIVVLAIIGCGRKYGNQETKFTRYMTKSSFGIYILHYPILIAVCYILYYHFDFPAIVNYVIAIVVEISMTFAAYEVIKRVPVIRYLVLGIKKRAD